MWPELGSNPQRRDGERFRALKINGLNHSRGHGCVCVEGGMGGAPEFEIAKEQVNKEL